MTILWAGTSIADMAIIGGGGAITTSGELALNVAEGINLTANSPCISPEFTPRNDLFASATLRQGGTNINGIGQVFRMFEFYNAAFGGILCLGALHLSTSQFSLVAQKWNGTTWVNVADAPSVYFAPGVRYRIDIYLKVHSTEGRIVVYVDGTKIIDFTGNTMPTGTGNMIARMGIARYLTNTTYSAMIISDIDSRPYNFYQLLPTGNGDETAWTGDYTSVDETGINDADAITSTAVGSVETFTFPDLPSDLNSLELLTVILSGRAQGSGSPGEIMGIARISTTNHESPGEYETSPNYLPQQWRFDLNPSTGLPWIGSQVNSAQFGVKAA